MNDDQARQTVIAAIVSVAPDTDPEAVDPQEDVWYALDLDSMDQLNVMVAVGDRTGIEIPEADYPKLETIAQLTGYLTGAVS